MITKQGLAKLKNSRLALVANFKKQKLERTRRLNKEQPCIDDNELSTSDTGDTDAYTDEETWFWNMSANEPESDTECNCYSDEEGDLGSAGSRTEEEILSETQPKERNGTKIGREICGKFMNMA